MGQGKNNRKKRHSQGKNGGVRAENDGAQAENGGSQAENGGVQAENGGVQVKQQDGEARKLEREIEEKEDNKLEEYGQVILEDNRKQRKIHLITIIGEVEGHENSTGSSKTTKYDHILPKLAEIEDDDSVDGLLVLLNTSGGDVDAGLAIAEMIASLSLPTVSLVLGGSHSIGVPLAVSTNYSFIVPSGTMMIHPVRMTGMVIGTSQTYEYFEMIQDRILTFVSTHADIAYDQLRELMHNTRMLTRDLGTVLVGNQAVDAGLINQVGGIKEALGKLYEMIDERERHC